MARSKKPATKKQAASTAAPTAPESVILEDREQASHADSYDWVPEGKATKKAKSRTVAPSKAKKSPVEPTPTSEPEGLVVFAFRLTQAEREEIHNAAGPAKASRFVRTVVLAAARRDLAAIKSAIADSQRVAST